MSPDAMPADRERRSRENRDVAVVTGAGTGLGRAYALDLARSGMRLLVNDVNAATAERTAQACRDLGTVALTDASAVGADRAAERIVGRAAGHFGRIDALVCNAGIVRDRTVGNLTDTDVDEVFSVHLRGVIDLVRAVWPRYKNQNYGRIVLVSSAAGLFGNIGQANYAAAKAGLVGLAKVLALEGERYGIATNVIAPIAQTDLAASALGSMFAGLSVDQIAPVVTYLCSPDCAVSGEVFAAGGGRLARLALAESRGVHFPAGFTSDDVAAQITTVCDMSGCDFPVTVEDHLTRYLKAGDAA